MALAQGQITGEGHFNYSFSGHCSVSIGNTATTLTESGSGTWDGSGIATEFFMAKAEGTAYVYRATITATCSANPWGDNTAACKLQSCEPSMSNDGGKSFFIPGAKSDAPDACKAQALKKAAPTTRFLVPVNQPLKPSHPSLFEFQQPAAGAVLAEKTCLDARLVKNVADKMNLVPNQNQVFQLYATLSWVRPDQQAANLPGLKKELMMQGNASSALYGQECINLPSGILQTAGIWEIRACLNDVPLKNTTARFSGCAERKVRVNTMRVQDAPPTSPVRAAPQLPGGSSWPPQPGRSESGRGASSAPDTARTVPQPVAPRTAPAAPERAAPAPQRVAPRQPAASEDAVRADPNAPVRGAPTRVPAQ